MNERRRSLAKLLGCAGTVGLGLIGGQAASVIAQEVPPNIELKYFQWEAEFVKPHSNTQRWGYLIPAGKLGIVTSAHCNLMRTGQATIADSARVCIHTVDNNFTNPVDLIKLTHQDATVGTGKEFSLGQCAVLDDTRRLIGSTMDKSTGGAYQFLMGATIMVFDRPVI